ncbi:MAG: glutamate--tRNA ligase [Candidatus Nomurabacteria bacterium]|nr:MAG: glutamate--tRNA ligase [Candidatus Nomurabacteria bacterium]
MNTDPKTDNHKIVTRFAPSPTGFMHIGSARTALFSYLFAKKHNGTFILRIEDTDKKREVADSISHIKETLTWLNIEWDYGPDKPGPFGSCIQSERLDVYHRYAKKLVDRGLAYQDPYTAEEIEAFKTQAKEAKKPFLFRNHRPDVLPAWDKTKPLRLKVPELKRYTWQDAVRGELSAGEEMLDDIVLIKSDGYPTYNFAHIVDDFEMGVTHIMRADEFIASTPKFLSIYDALEIPYPVFVTLPPILRDDRTKKLGKRDGAKDIFEYRDEGFLPETMVNFLALTGWNPGTEQEVFTFDDLVAAFDVTKIQKAGAVFNEEKLLWMNKQHLAKLSDDEVYAYVSKALPDELKVMAGYSEDILKKLVPTIMERAHIAAEISEAAKAGEYDFAFVTPAYETDILKWKKDNDVIEALPRLQKALNLLKEADFSTPDSVKNDLWDYAEEVGRGELLWPLRVALSGRERSPDPFTIAYIIGREETLKRISVACDKIKR